MKRTEKKNSTALRNIEFWFYIISIAYMVIEMIDLIAGWLD